MPDGVKKHGLPVVRVVESPIESVPADSAWGAPWKGSRLRHLSALAILIFAGLTAMTVDIPLSRALYQDKTLHRLHGFLGSMEPFGQPAAIVMTALAIGLCDIRRRRLMLRLLVASLGAGLSADVVKLLVARTRPHHYDLAGSVLSTFQQLLPGWGAGSRLQSFPSAHTATAVGFCLALSALFPRGSRLFAIAAGLVALQRVEAGAHYLSDTCWGAAVGFAVSMLIFRRDLAGGWFDRWESCGALSGESHALGTQDSGFGIRDSGDKKGDPSIRERFSVVSIDD
jgi:membrane-associated phospholipid phosphatase